MSIHGVGVDIVDLARFARLTAGGHTRLLQRWFTPAEQTACDAAADPTMRYAQVFAAKEAAFKALALPDWDGRVPWAWIGIRPRRGRSAAVTLNGPVAAAAGPGIHVAVDVSATVAFVTARAVAYREIVTVPA